MRLCLRLSAVIAVGLLCLSFAFAQQADPGLGAGVVPHQTYLGEKENINLGTGNVNLQIPLLHLPGRDGHDFSLGLSYSSQIWYVHTFTNPQTHQVIYQWAKNTSGWYWNIPTLTSDANVPPYSLTPGPYTCNGNYRLTLWDGRVIYFPYVYSNCVYTNSSGQQSPAPGKENLIGSEGVPLGSSYACAPDFAVLTVNDSGSPFKVTLRTGETLWFLPSSGNPSYLSKDEDANGNIITYSTGPPWVITDTMGRTITITSTGQSSGTVTYTDSNGNQQTITLTAQGFTFPTHFPTNLYGEQNQSFSYSLLTSIQLPNGDEWDMQYAPDSGGYGYGELTKITYPTGGYTTYQYEFSGEAPGDTSGAAGRRQVYAKQTCRDFNSRNEGSCTVLDSTTITPTPLSTWSTNGSSQVLDGVGDKTIYTFAGLGSTAGYETKRQIYSGSSTLVETVSTTPTCYGPTQQVVTLPNGLVSEKDLPADIPPNSFYGYQTTTIDTSNTVTTSSEYDWGNGARGLLRRQVVTTLMAVNPVNSQNYTASNINVLGRKLSEVVKDGSGSTVAQTQYEYDNYSSTAPHGSMSASGATQHDAAYSTSYTARGNVTQTQHWLNTNSTWLPTTNTYDDAGNVLQTTDPLSNITGFSYADSWGNATCTPSGGSASAYLTSTTNALGQVTKHSYNSCTGTLDSTTDPNNQVTTFRTTTGSAAYDALHRLTQTNYPDGGKTTVCYSDAPGSGCNSSQPQLSTTTTTLITSSLSKTSVWSLDGVGSVVRTALTSDTSPDYVDTVYDGEGRKVSVSNPYQNTTDQTYGLTTYVYDPLNRVKTMIPQDGTSSVNNVGTQFDIAYPTTSPTENCNIVTDEAGKARKSCSDGLGRLVQVFEDPSTLNYETDYSYDSLNNLIGVTQKGSDSTKARTRNFQYDSLSRLTSATNPESGTISYTYDNDGNVLTKTAPLPNQASPTTTVTTSYTYDALNRLTSKSYKDGTTQDPYTTTVKYGYDGVPLTGCTIAPPGDTDSYPIGRSTAMCDGSGGTSWVHDKMGRVKEQRRAIGALSVSHYIDYTYNLDGSLSVLQTPPMKTLNYTYNGAGRATQLLDSTDSLNFVTSATYTPPGGLTGMTMGSASGFAGISIKNAYNNRLQPVQLYANSPSGTILSICYDYHFGLSFTSPYCSFTASTLGNNGNVLQVTNNRDTNRNQIFAYDALNRIASGQSSGTGSISWGENYQIDGWGNLYGRTGISGQANTEPLNCPPNTNNQLTGCSKTYDAAGNLTVDGLNNYTYDAENRLIWTNSSPNSYRYLYDGNGQRVEKCQAATATTACPITGTTGTLYWRGTGSDTLAETDLAGNDEEEYIFFNGARIARRDVNSSGGTVAVHYYFSDHLGTTSLVTNATGTLALCGSYTVPTGEEESDYYPYGGEIVLCNSVPQNYKFTGKERDGESGLDYFGARHYNSALGRFMVPDWAARPTAVPYAVFGDPQSLNLYLYVRNDPVTLADADGHCWGWLAVLCKGPGGQSGPGDSHADAESLSDKFVASAKAGAAQNNEEKRHELAHRIVLGIRGLLDIQIGKAKIAAGVASGVTTPGTGALGAAGLAYGVGSGTGQVVQGGAELIGAVTGNTKEVETLSDGIAASTTIGGIIGTVVSNGNLETAAKWSAVEQLGTSALKREIFTDAVENVLSTIDLVKSGSGDK